MKITLKLTGWFLLAMQETKVLGFSTTRVPVSNAQQLVRPSSSFLMSTTDSEATEKTGVSEELYIPLSFDEMVKQSSAAMEDAYAQGLTRQMVRILLPRSSDNDQLLQYYEDDADVDMSETVLVPPDETWQGGIMQLYRAASISCQEILR